MPCRDMYICMYKKQVVFSDLLNKAEKKISDYVTPVTMFTTGILTPKDITGNTSGDLLVCLRQELSDTAVPVPCSRLFSTTRSVTLCSSGNGTSENVNGDIIVNDIEKNNVITVDRLGIFRYSYSLPDSTLLPLESLLILILSDTFTLQIVFTTEFTCWTETGGFPVGE